MQISTQMTAPDKAMLDEQIRTFNRTLTNKVDNPQALGKDDFLKILITQLSHQDPTKPMEDKEFIAQMAQFSSLEQMNNMASQMENLSQAFTRNQSMSLLGKSVELMQGENSIVGRVEALSTGPNPRLQVNGNYYSFDQVSKVME